MVKSKMGPESNQPDRIAPTAGIKGSRGPRQGGQRPPAEGETRGRKLSLPDSIYDRLWLYAREKHTTVSAAATEILDTNLPRFRVEREG